MKFQETETVELKAVAQDGIKKEIVAFANSNGGTVYVGVGDDGTAYGNRSKWERTPENEILWTLASQIQVETDEARRAELSEELQREYAKDNPLAFLLQHPKTFAYSTNTLEKVTYNDLCKIELCELTAK